MSLLVAYNAKCNEASTRQGLTSGKETTMTKYIDIQDLCDMGKRRKKMATIRKITKNSLKNLTEIDVIKYDDLRDIEDYVGEYDSNDYYRLHTTLNKFTADNDNTHATEIYLDRNPGWHGAKSLSGGAYEWLDDCYTYWAQDNPISAEEEEFDMQQLVDIYEYWIDWDNGIDFIEEVQLYLPELIDTDFWRENKDRIRDIIGIDERYEDNNEEELAEYQATINTILQENGAKPFNIKIIIISDYITTDMLIKDYLQVVWDDE